MKITFLLTWGDEMGGTLQRGAELLGDHGSSFSAGADSESSSATRKASISEMRLTA